MSYFLVHGTLLHSWSRCLWVSSSFLQNLHMMSLCWFLWLAFAGIILLLSFTIALHCFLLSLFMWSGRLPPVVSALLSAHSLTLDFDRASISTVLFICSAILVPSSFFRVGFVSHEISSGILSSFIILIVFSFHVLLFPWVIFLISAVSGFFWILCHCIILFL